MFPRPTAASRPDAGLEQRAGVGGDEVLAATENAAEEAQTTPVTPPRGVTATTATPPASAPVATAIVVIGPDGVPLPTSRDGLVLDRAGSPLPTRADGLVVGADGMPLPTDAQGRFLHITVPMQGDAARTLPTDDYGHQIHPVVDQFGRTLRTDASGHYLDERGEAIGTDEFGRPVDPQGRVFRLNAQGQYVYTRPDNGLSKARTTAESAADGQIAVVDADGKELERDEHGGVVVGGQRKVLATSADGLLLGPDGSPLPTNADGQFVYAWAAEADTGAAPQLVTDSSGRVLQPVVGPDGSPLVRDPRTGHYMAPDGTPIGADEQGRPLDKAGKVLGTNIYGGAKKKN